MTHDQSYLGNVTAPGEILEKFKDGYLSIAEAIELLDQVFAAPAQAKPDPALRNAAIDALAGWKYIRKYHGDLYGVGWDRVEIALEAALAPANHDSDCAIHNAPALPAGACDCAAQLRRCGMKSISLRYIKRVGLIGWKHREWWCTKEVMIWSNEHAAWWRPEGKGYTILKRDAWVVDFPTAYDHTKHCGPEKQISYYVPPGVAVASHQREATP